MATPWAGVIYKAVEGSEDEHQQQQISLDNKAATPMAMSAYPQFGYTYHPTSPAAPQEAKEEFNKRYEITSKSSYIRSNFEFIKTIGEGSFGRVYLARLVKEEKYYAIKTFDKSILIKKALTKQILQEKRILQALNYPGCIYLEMTFQDNAHIYLGLPFISGGELYNYLLKMGKFEESASQFYGAQVLLAIEYLHYCDVIYRDLKPENILIDVYGYLKLTDFGLSKVVTQRTYSLCGTPDYFAPEVLMHRGYGKSVDYWSYGVFLFEITSGKPPFVAPTMMKTYENILTVAYSMPKYFSRNLAHLIYNLLQIDISRRFGSMKNAIEDIKSHAWFSKIEWNLLFNRKIAAPYSPNVRKPGDTRNFGHFKEKKLRLHKANIEHEDFNEF
ncbi:unnamed protein product [Nezara viridula]|uniref:cAMP-dependent protein kinase n=1 Tax=Nezara viridula TaxID=85310 RepID=A0A9P0DX57_NEZVI|nr:unnamed protein product [Nezara viridula]